MNRSVALASTALLVAACARPSGAGAERRAPALAGPVDATPFARWIVPSSAPIETIDGTDHVIVDGRRLEVRGVEIVGAAPQPELDGGAKVPPWAARSDLGFVFWRRDVVYGAPTFDGPVRLLGRVRGRVYRAFDWLSGVGLSLDGATALVDGGGHVSSFGAPATSNAIALDARRAARLDAFGDVRFTPDGGATWRDVPLGARATNVFRRGAAIAVDVDDATRELDARGEPVPGLLRSLEPHVETGERWPGGRRRALAVLAASGAPLGEGGAVMVGDGHVGRIDLATLRTTSIAPFPAIAVSSCEPFHAKDAWLVVCQSESEATVYDVDGEPRLERTFSPLLEGVARFVVSDEIGAIGFLGPCDGRDVPLARDTSDRGFPPASPVFCVRGKGGGWVEHAVSNDEAAELVAWIPRAAGGAAVLLAPPAAKLQSPAVSQRGDLRVVRAARDVPPAPFGSFMPRGAELVDRAFTVDASGAIEGWLVTGSSPGTTSIRVDAEGRVTARPLPPRAAHVAFAGPVALAVSDDGAYHQSVDRGRTWTPTAAPPASFNAARLQCSPVGCVLGGLARLGWDRAPVKSVEAPLVLPAVGRNRGERVEPVARLVCGSAEAPRSSRQEELLGFGVVRPSPAQSSTVVPVRDVGVAIFPPSVALLMSGDVEADLAWLAPLDPAARVRRIHLASAHIGVQPREIPFLGVSVAPLLRADGDVDLVASHSSDACFDTLLETAGIVRRGFGCVAHDALAVEIGKRVWIGEPHGNTLEISTHALDRAAAATPAIDATTRFASGRWFGLGARANAPVAVFVDLDGGAVLTPIDPVRGTLGHQEPLRSLSALELATAPACASSARDAALVLLSFEGAIAIDAREVVGVSPGDERGIAVIRWSREHACLEAVRLPIRDERVEPDPNGNAGPTSQRRVVGRFAGRAARATLVDIGPGVELRQTLACDRVEPR